MRCMFHTLFIYEADNIPDHRSRRFGRCPSLLAVIWFASHQQKSRIRAATQTRQAQNEPLAKAIRSALSSYHAGLRSTSRNGQFSVNLASHLITKENTLYEQTHDQPFHRHRRAKEDDRPWPLPRMILTLRDTKVAGRCTTT